MKRVLRDVVVGAMSAASAGALLTGAGFALAQDMTPTPAPLRPTLDPNAQAGTPTLAGLQVAPVGGGPRSASPFAGAVKVTPAQASPGSPGAAPPATAPPTTPAPAAAAPPPAEEAPGPVPVVNRIVVEGNQRVESSTVASYLLVRRGEAFDPERIDLSIKTLFATGLFADVEISQRGSDLVVKVVENPIVNRVVFEGLNALDEDDITKEIQAKPRAIFTPARVQADVQRIMELYRRQGRFAATVTPQVRELEQNRVDLIFEVDEGPVTGVRSINFIGNEAYNDDQLRESIYTEEKAWWRFFSNRSNYDPDAMEQDREMLRQFYTNRGYADFRVVSAVAELTPDQTDFFITFNIEEGVKYDFGAVTVKTSLDRMPADLLKAVIPIQEGGLFQGELIEKAIDAITFTAGTGGYANVRVTPEIVRDPETRKVNIVFNVDEGDRVFVERINIIGNTRTVDSVIRRELRLAEGDAFNRVLLDRSRARVRALGFFKRVELEEEDGGQPDRKVVNVKVEEDSTGELAFAAGYSSQDQFLFDVSVTERNLRGRGQYLRLRASTSSRRQQLDISFREPRFMDRDLAVQFDLFSFRNDFLAESSFENQSTGFGLRAGFPLNDTTSLGLNYILRQDTTEIDDILVESAPGVFVDQCSTANPNRPLLCAQEGEFVTSLLGYRFNWDMRNDPVNPTRGFDLQFFQDFAGLGGEVKYLKSELSGGLYYGIWDDVVASFSLNAGYIVGWGGDDVRINDRFFKGGSTFRGFDVAGLGPREQIVIIDPATGNRTTIKGDALGGNAYAIGTLQVTFPTGLPDSFGVSGAAFAEFGTLGILNERDKRSETFVGLDGSVVNRFVDDAASLRASAGISIFWDSPFGPVQFDFAKPLAKEPYDETQEFRFSTRTRF
jgi:outer membrane protein insertion porin family